MEQSFTASQIVPALQRVMVSVLKDDMELFKQFSDNKAFRRWLTDTVLGLTYEVDTPP